MLKNRLQNYINEMLLSNENQLELFKEEKQFAEKHHLVPDNVIVVEKDAPSRFADAYVERCEKGTMGLVLVEIPKFLDERMDHLQKHSREFVFVESLSFRLLGIDAVSLEFDELSTSYKVKLGLKMQKQHESALQNHLEQGLNKEEFTYHLAFSGKDDLWNVQFTLDALTAVQGEMTLLNAYECIYQFLFAFVATIEATE